MGVPQSGHYITIRFDPFSLPTYRLLQKGQYHSTFGVQHLAIFFIYLFIYYITAGIVVSESTIVLSM